MAPGRARRAERRLSRPELTTLLAYDPIEFHRFGLAGREPLLLMLAASLLTFTGTRAYTRIGRLRAWGSGNVGGIHVHHMVLGIVLVLISGMLDIALRPGHFGRELVAIAFGAGAAFILDEFALSVHVRDVYWTPEGRHSIEVSIIWLLLGLLLLVGISPFGIHDHTEIPRIIGVSVITVNIALSMATCLKGKLTLALLSIFLPPVGIVATLRLARPGSIWAQQFYRGTPKLDQAIRRFDPAHSDLERLRHRFADFLGGSHDDLGSTRPPLGPPPPP